MSAPSKLAVEIAEAVLRDNFTDVAKIFDEEYTPTPSEIEKAAALIDAKIRPLVEDSGRLYKALNAWVTDLERTAIVGSSSGDIHAIYCDARIALSNSAHFEGFEANGVAFEKAHALMDQAFAQRPAQEGSA